MNRREEGVAMDEPGITYRYFRLPHQFSNFLFEPRR
jgi:hypothetical protein